MAYLSHTLNVSCTKQVPVPQLSVQFHACLASLPLTPLSHLPTPAGDKHQVLFVDYAQGPTPLQTEAPSFPPVRKCESPRLVHHVPASSSVTATTSPQHPLRWSGAYCPLPDGEIHEIGHLHPLQKKVSLNKLTYGCPQGPITPCYNHSVLKGKLCILRIANFILMLLSGRVF